MRYFYDIYLFLDILYVSLWVFYHIFVFLFCFLFDFYDIYVGVNLLNDRRPDKEFYRMFEIKYHKRRINS